MTSTPNSNNTGRPSNQKAEYMVIELSYSCKLLFPMEQGNEFLKAYSAAKEYKAEYQKPIIINESPPAITITYLTPGDIAKINFDRTLGVNDD